jgi:hypothetical protein
MNSTFALPDGSRLSVTALHAAGAVCVTQIWPTPHLKPLILHIPVDFSGVFAQAIECAGQKIETGPCAQVSA